jgi:putative peptide zinc metalloprotease protein
MSDNLLSSSWYRVAQLKPRRSPDTRLHRHHYRGQIWYVLQNRTTRRCQLLTPSAHLLIGLMDGERTTNEVWEEAARQLGDDCPTQDETIRLLGMMYLADSLSCDVSPDTDEMFRRTERRETSETWRRLLHPLSLRFPLLDPDAFLSRWVWLARPLFSVYGALAWCAIVGLAAVLGASHWQELGQDAGSKLLSGQSLLLMGIAYPCLKALHELGHGFAAKVWDAEVHEMGIMMLVLMPVPYVDASAANVFPDKRRRMTVAAAGIGVEVLIAALALLVWLAVEPGFVRSLAYGIFWLSGASTVLFNANPLLRFDGYFILSDWIEIPNLGTRSNQYLGYLIQRHLFGLSQVRCPVNEPGERAWFVGYGIAAFVYRILIVFGIALFLASRFFVVGVLLALLSLAVQIVAPAIRQVANVLSSPRYGERRTRIVAASSGVLAAAALALLALPVPLYTTARGVVWLPERAQLRAGADAFVTRLLVEANVPVRAGEPVVVAHDPLLDSRVAVLKAELRALRARHYEERVRDLVQAQITEEEIATAEASLARALERTRDVVIRSPEDGELVLPRADDLVGRFVRQGEIVGYVIGAGRPTARVVLSEADVELVRERTEAVDVRLARDLADVRSASIVRVVPAATQRLPSKALGTGGGGEWPVDPADPEGLQTLVPVFELDLALPEDAEAGAIGEAVYVRFDHGLEPFAMRAYRGLRRLLLSRLSV